MADLACAAMDASWRGPHCTSCGADTGDPALERHRTCPPCGHVDHANPAPAVGIAIVGEGKVLLARRGRAPKEGQWDLVGGFIEPGEDGEAAIRREVKEETGLDVPHVGLMTTAPGTYGGMPTFNLLFLGQAPSPLPLPEGRDDVAELRWFPLTGLPGIAWEHEAGFLQDLAREWERAISGPAGASGA